MDDIGGLNRLITNQKTAERVLSKQVQHVNRVLPYFLSGMLVTGFIFFFMMEFALHPSLFSMPLHSTWIICHSLTIGICWGLWKKALSSSTHITHKFIKTTFIYLTAYFLITDVIGCLLFFFLNQYYGLIEIQPKLFYIWIFYHNLGLYLCYSNCKNIDKMICDLQNTNQLSPVTAVVDLQDLHFEPKTNHEADYLASYTAYKVLFTCMLLLGCLWAIGVVKVITNNFEFSVQMLVLIGLNFAIISGAMSSIGIFRQVFNAFSIPSLLTWAAILLYIDDMQLIVLSVVIIIFVFTHSYFAKYNWLNSIKTIQIYLENTHLVSQLEAKSQQLQRISTAKTNFLASASHDLRQPAHALSLFIETLSRTELNDTQKKIVGYAKTASKSSSDMLNTILDYAHLESGEMIPNIVSTDLDIILHNLVDEFRPEAELKGLELRYHHTNLCVMSDPAMLSLILRNFLSNAIRYTTKGGILIGVRYTPSKNAVNNIEKCKCRVSVWDTGKGIKTDELYKVFDSFHQLETHTQSNKGLGLGLSIAKGMANLLDVPINVRSEFGRGTQFSIDLTICKSEDDIHIVSEAVKIEEAAIISVLVVDDEDSVLISMELLLQSWGYTVLIASNVTEAISQYRLHQPQIIITDYQLDNNRTGMEVLKTVNMMAALNGTQSLPQCLMFTGNTSPEIVKATQKMGVSLLHKPIAPDTLRHRLKEFTAKL